MKIGKYEFNEFMTLIAEFHGCAAPGVLLGAYMVEHGKSLLPKDCLFEAISETPFCLPDAIQILTLCSTGNGRLTVHNIGRYALTLYDKNNFQGYRVAIDSDKLQQYAEFNNWFFKLTKKQNQNSEQLIKEIREANIKILKTEKVKVIPETVAWPAKGEVGLCPICHECYPLKDGETCLSCAKKIILYNTQTRI